MKLVIKVFYCDSLKHLLSVSSVFRLVNYLETKSKKGNSMKSVIFFSSYSSMSLIENKLFNYQTVTRPWIIWLVLHVSISKSERPEPFAQQGYRGLHASSNQIKWSFHNMNPGAHFQSPLTPFRPTRCPSFLSCCLSHLRSWRKTEAKAKAPKIISQSSIKLNFMNYCIENNER